MTYHVITPLRRYQNAARLLELLEPQGIIWHPIMDDDGKFTLSFYPAWVAEQVVKLPEGGTFFERCNTSINLWMDRHDWQPEDYYCILNDDDAYEPGFFDKIRRCSDDVIVPSMMRGNQTPADVSPERAHGTDTLLADPSNMQVGRIGVEQMIVKGRILKNCRLPLTIAGDGEMLTYIGATNPVTYMPDAYVWFNYLEPGRWNK